VQLVEVIVAWPFDEDAIDVAAVLADCETVLRAGDGRPDDLLTSVAAGSERRFASPPPGLPVVNDGPEPSADSPLSLARPLPGGGLPVKPEGVPGLPDSIADAYPQPIPGARRGDRHRLPPPEIYAPLAIPLDAETSGPSAGKADPTAPSNEPATIADSEQNPLQDLDDVALMRRLQDGSRSEHAAAELRRRGFDALRLEIARRLTHPEPQIRKELANALPQLPGVDAQPWLEELAADRDPEVRRVAISILGSDANPQVDAWLRERRREERDPRVAEMIDEILEKRR